MKSKILKNIWLWKIRRNKRRKINVNKHKIIPTLTLTPTPITTITVTTVTTVIITANKAKRIKLKSQIEKKEYSQHYLNIPKSMNPLNPPYLLDGSLIIAILSESLLKTQFLLSIRKLPNLKMDQLYFKMHWRIRDQIKTTITTIIITTITAKSYGIHLFLPA